MPEQNNESELAQQPSAAEPQEHRAVRVGITHGDTNGVGYELIFKTFSNPAMTELCIPVVYGSAKAAAYHRKSLNTETQFHIVPSADEASEGRLNLINCFDDEVKIELGKVSPEAGKAARLSLERAVSDLKAGLIDVLVTAPICKEAIQSKDFHYTGHTEFLQANAPEGSEALMILANRLMRVALVTVHVPVKDIAQLITTERVLQKIRQFYASLRRDFLLPAPRIAVLGLNPHCGDGGTVGNEESEHIAPAIKQAVEEGIPCFGPFSADGFFGAGMYSQFDGVLAMYHDQGLAPFKALSMDDGINFTAGLPFVRTSPDHGTAFDIAGKNKANEASFRQAVYTAIDIFRNRRADDEAHRNPLPKLYHERREDSDRQRRYPQAARPPRDRQNPQSQPTAPATSTTPTESKEN